MRKAKEYKEKLSRSSGAVPSKQSAPHKRAQTDMAALLNKGGKKEQNLIRLFEGGEFDMGEYL